MMPMYRYICTIPLVWNNNFTSSSESEVLVAEFDGKLVRSGYVRIRNADSFLEHTHFPYPGFMYVKPTFRGKGINQLILEAINWAKAKDIFEIKLEVYDKKTIAKSAYRKAGLNHYCANEKENLKYLQYFISSKGHEPHNIGLPKSVSSNFKAIFNSHMDLAIFTYGHLKKEQQIASFISVIILTLVLEHPFMDSLICTVGFDSSVTFCFKRLGEKIFLRKF
jgi:hypothetical protein